MKMLRENVVPAAFLALWRAASGYTLHELGRMRASPIVHATMDLTVTPHVRGASHTSCSEIPGLRSDAEI
jgi:hypothetical protein